MLGKKGIHGLKNVVALGPLERVKTETYYVVPIIVKDNNYEVFLSNGLVRMFNDDTLPSFLKSRLTLAKVSTTYIFPDDEIYAGDVYTCRVNDMHHVGWRASESVYAIVVFQDEINQLEGRDDTRSQS
jgi:hypothetical protein